MKPEIHSDHLFVVILILSLYSWVIFQVWWASSAPLFAHTIPAAARALMLALCGLGRKGIQVLTVLNLFRPL